VVCRFRADGKYLDSSIVAEHWLTTATNDKTLCWYPPERWQNSPGQFRIEPADGQGEWFEVSPGHVHNEEICTMLFREAHNWLENVRMRSMIY